MSLQNRVSIAVGLQNGGHGECWCSVFNELNIKITPSIQEYFQEKGKSIRKSKKRRAQKSTRHIKVRKNGKFS